MLTLPVPFGRSSKLVVGFIVDIVLLLISISSVVMLSAYTLIAADRLIFPSEVI